MIQFYHPSSSNKGFACSFFTSKRNGSLFAQLIKQAGWDAATENGSFKENKNNPDKSVTVKLSDVEAAAILLCIEKNQPFSTAHDFNNPPRAISFTPWMSKAFENTDGQTVPASQRGYSFTITIGGRNDPNKNSFYIGLTFPEGRLLREFLVHHLHKSFETPWSIKNQDESQESAEDTAPEVNNAEGQPSNSLVNI